MDNKPIRSIFIGTPDFAVPGLRSLLNDQDFEIIAVITKEDKRVGRKQILSESPIKTLAKEAGIKVIETPKISEIRNEIADLKPDIMIVIAFGQIIPKSILDIPKYGCVNVHGSLLPKYRGASCVAAAIRNQDQESGITIMLMDEKMDTGPILTQARVLLTGQENSNELSIALSQLGAKLLPNTVKDYIEGKITPQAQNNQQASYVKLLKNEDALIDWHQTASAVYAHIRSVSPWPGAFSFIDGLKIKIIESSFYTINSDKELGTIISQDGKCFVQCADQALEIRTWQVSGKKAISAKEFLSGYSRYIGKILK